MLKASWKLVCAELFDCWYPAVGSMTMQAADDMFCYEMGAPDPSGPDIVPSAEVTEVDMGEVFSDDVFVPSEVEVPKAFSEKTPQEILLSALLVDDPQLNFRVKSRRIGSKRKCCIEEDRANILQWLVTFSDSKSFADSIESFLTTHTSHALRITLTKGLRNFFDRCYSKQSGKSIRDVRRDITDGAWKALNWEFYMRWLFLSRLHHDLYQYNDDIGGYARIEVPVGSVLRKDMVTLRMDKVFTNVPGVMTTHQTSAFRDNPVIKKHRERNSSVEVFKKALQNTDEFRWDVTEFKKWAKDTAASLGAVAYSLGIEINENPSEYGRVHRHCMFSGSPLPHEHPWARADVKLVTASVKQLIFNGAVPHVSALYSKNGKGNLQIVQRGHYYVQGPKTGQVFAEGFVWNRRMRPMEDR